MKAIIAGGVAGLLDKYVLNESVMENSIMFGASVATGIWLGDIVGNAIPDNMRTSLFDGKTVETRILEIGGTVGVAYGASKLAGREILPYNALNKIGIVVVSDVVGTYASDYISGKPLEFL